MVSVSLNLQMQAFEIVPFLQGPKDDMEFPSRSHSSDDVDILNLDNPEPIRGFRERAVTIPSSYTSLKSLVGEDGDQEEYDEAIQRAKRAGRRSVRFSANLEIDFVPNDLNARTSRAGAWGIAPYNDEYWDGSKQSFRDRPISREELTQENIKHAILSVVNQTVHSVRTIFGLKPLQGIKSLDEEKVETDCVSDLEKVFQTMCSAFANLNWGKETNKRTPLNSCPNE